MQFVYKKLTLALRCCHGSTDSLVFMKRTTKILIVEDEEPIRTGLVDVFVFHGYSVESCDNGNDGLHKSLSGQFDMILLDVMLPGLNGFDICNEIRQHDRSQPIIMLTAKNSDDDIIQGLKYGADDYVSKPFSITELLLRVEAVLRRATHDDDSIQKIRLGPDHHIDTQNMCGTMGSTTVMFTRKEIDVLSYLATNTNRPVSREELLTRVWGYAANSDIETRTIDIHIAKIRRKIEIDPKSPTRLLTVRAAGYRLLIDQ